MGRNYNEQDLEQAIRRTAPGGPPRPDFAQWREKHPEAFHASGGDGERAARDRSIGSVLRFGRNVMRRKRVRFGAIAAAVALAMVFFGTGTDKAWSVEQTLAAMKNIETVYVAGKALWSGKAVDFECWVRLPGKDSNSLRMRFECDGQEKTTVVVQGNTVYAHSPVKNTVSILDGSKIEDLQYWYEGVQINPWVTARLLDTLRLVGRDWEQEVETDPNTGKEQIVVTCNHPPSHGSARLVVDPESKLVLKARLWGNFDRRGQPAYDAQAIAYNPPIPDEYFEFQIPAGATVINEQETQALFEQAERLFHQDKKYAEAVAAYQQVYDRHPLAGWGSTSLMMIGICHTYLGDNAKAIEFYQRALREFPTGWEGVIQFYLGAAYRDSGQTQEALKAFEDCLADAEGKRAADQFPVKEARKYIAKLKGK